MTVAGWSGSPGIVLNVIRAGASIDHQDNVSVCLLNTHTQLTQIVYNRVTIIMHIQDGQTALIKASVRNHTEIVRLLIENGANVDLQDEVN